MMIILAPYAHECIWGGRRLAKYFENPPERIGHMYSLFDDTGRSNTILNGEYMGMSFHDYFLTHREKYGLGCYERFPLVVALVDAHDDLSIQVHPPDDAAKVLEDAPFGKNESWYFLKKPDTGRIYMGTSAASSGEIAEFVRRGEGRNVADTLPIREGDYVYVAAGTLHALSAGSFVYEIEENSEYTYRVYDFDRRDATGSLRPLHIEKAVASVDITKRSVPRRYDGAEIEERMYSTALLPPGKHKNTSKTLECLTVIDEEASFSCEGVKAWFGTTVVIEPDEEIFLPSRVMLARPKNPWRE